MTSAEEAAAERRSPRRIAAHVALGAFLFLALSIGALPGPLHRIGMADNGDLERVACDHRLQPVDPGSPPYFAYATTTWRLSRHGTYTCRSHEHYPSSYHLVLRWLTRLHRSDGTVDLRLQAWLFALTISAGIGLIAGMAARLTPAAGYSIGASATLIVADTAFAGYLQSLYPEALALALLPIALALVAWAGARWAVSARAGLAVTGGCLAVTALIALTKPQLAAAALVLPAALVAREAIDRRRRLPIAAAIAGALVLAPLVLASVGEVPPSIRDTNAYDRVFQLALHHSNDPAGDLRAMGLSPALAPYADVPFWDAVKPDGHGHLCFVPLTPSPPITRAGCARWRAFRRATSTRAAMFLLLRHPIRAAQTTADASVATFALVDPVFGNRTANSGAPPRARDVPVGALLAVAISLQPAAPLLLPLSWIGCAALAITTIRLARKRPGAGTALDASTALAACTALAVACFATALASDGMTDIIKHNVFTAYLTALLLPLAAWTALERSRVKGLPVAGAGPTSPRGSTTVTDDDLWVRTDDDTSDDTDEPPAPLAHPRVPVAAVARPRDVKLPE